MKVTTRDFNELLFAIAPLDSRERRERYLRGDYPRADKTRDLDKRYRWDLFWVVVDAGFKWKDVGEGGYRDAHIDTALRRIVVPLNEGVCVDPESYIPDGESEAVRF
jgi:hypothetical protein